MVVEIEGTSNLAGEDSVQAGVELGIRVCVEGMRLLV
jgi:hypothetical protein